MQGQMIGGMIGAAAGNRTLTTAQPETRTPVAIDVVRFAELLANRAQSLAERTNVKLHPVMTADYPRPCAENLKEQEYPPLFAELRNNFQAIAGALDTIEHALSRTEL